MKENEAKNFVEEYIRELMKENKNAVIYLINGIKLQGNIKDFDSETKCIIITGTTNDMKQLVFLHAVSTISNS